MKHLYFKVNCFFSAKGIILFLFLSVWCFYQSPAQTIDAGNDTIICSGNSATLTAVATGVNATNTYQISAIAYDPPAALATGTPSNTVDDGVRGPFPIGFTFCYFGNLYTQFYIGSNGWISFSPGQPTTYDPKAIPSTSGLVPKNAIMGPWEDWDPGLCAAGGCVRYQTIGTAPNRIMVVSWNLVPMFLCTATLGTFQIAIKESSNIIENHLLTKPNCPGWVGGRGVQGLHNAAGTIAHVVPGRNNTMWITGNEATRYTPNGIPGEIRWYTNTTLVGIGASITVSPTATTTYRAEVVLCNGVIISDEKLVTVNPALTLTTGANDIACGAGTGSAYATVGGGSLPYTYSWSPGGSTNDTASNLNAGTYNVTVTDGIGCTKNGFAVVANLGGLSADTASVNHVSCYGGNDGSATVTPSGGTPPYTYDWVPAVGADSSATGLSAGTYTVTVTDFDNCNYTLSITITEPPEITFSKSQENVSCNGRNDGSALVLVSGGNPSYTYTWSPGAGANDSLLSQVPAGTYNLLVQDKNGCEDTLNIIITEPPAITTTVLPDHVSCYGGNDGSATVNALGGTPPYTYNWVPAMSTDSIISGQSSGVHTVSVYDANGCEKKDSVTITEPPEIILSLSTTLTCNKDSNSATVSVSGGTEPYSYIWTPTGGSGPTKERLSPGSYTITVNDSKSCSEDTSFTIPDIEPLILEINNADSVCEGENVTINATAMGGTEPYTFTWAPGNNEGSSLTVTPFVTTTYTVTVTDSNNCTAPQKVTVEVFPSPVADFNMDPAQFAMVSKPVSFNDLSKDAVFWDWDFGDALQSGSFLKDPLFTYTELGSYIVGLNVTSKDGCKDSVSHTIIIEAGLTVYIPNAFSPDDDGLNDYFGPKSTELESFEMQIYNQWGENIYHTMDVDKPWDGKLNNQMAQEGVYSYKIRVKDSKGSSHYYIGNVTLIK